MTSRRFAIALAVSLGLAALLRFLGIMHGWPRNYIPDTTAVRAALSIGAGANPFAGDALPTQYPYLLPYLLAALYGVFFVLGWIGGVFANLAAFERYAFAHPEVFFLIASGAVATSGCVVVLQVALVTRRLLGEAAACLAALFTATSLIHVQLSHQARPHLLTVALILAALQFALRHLADGRRRNLPLSWLCSAAAASTVPYGLLSLAIPLLAGIRRKDLGGTLRNTLLGGALFLATLVLFYPRLVIGDPVAYDSSTGLFRSYGGLYLRDSFINGKGLPKLIAWLGSYEPVLALCAALGIAVGLSHWRRDRRWAAVAVFPLLYVAVYGSYEVIHPRYLVPLIPFLSIPAGWLAARWAGWLSEGAATRFGERWRAPAAVALAIALLGLPTVQALRLDLLLRRQDTRAIAERWIGAHLRQSRLIATEAHGVDLPPDLDSLRWTAAHHPDQLGLRDRHRLRSGADGAAGDGFPVAQLWYHPTYRDSAIGELEHYAESEHVVAVLGGETQRVDPFYRSLVREGRLLTRVSPLCPNVAAAETQLPVELQRPLRDLWKVERCGPIIEIYELRRE